MKRAAYKSARRVRLHPQKTNKADKSHRSRRQRRSAVAPWLGLGAFVCQGPGRRTESS